MINAVGANTQINYGILPETSAVHADGIATREALRLAAMSFCTWPSTDEQIIKLVTELLVKQVQNFAIAARRAIELENLPRIEVLDRHNHDGLKVNVERYSDSFRAALGMIIHAQKIIVITWTTGNKLFTQASDRRVTHVQVQSDKGEVYLCPFGLAHTYLSRHDLAGIKPGEVAE